MGRILECIIYTTHIEMYTYAKKCIYVVLCDVMTSSLNGMYCKKKMQCTPMQCTETQCTYIVDSVEIVVAKPVEAGQHHGCLFSVGVPSLDSWRSTEDLL